MAGFEVFGYLYESRVPTPSDDLFETQRKTCPASFLKQDSDFGCASGGLGPGLNLLDFEECEEQVLANFGMQLEQHGRAQLVLGGTGGPARVVIHPLIFKDHARFGG
jgi:hypothetical protein